MSESQSWQHHSQIGKETSYIYINRKTDTKNMVQIHNGVPFSFKKQQILPLVTALLHLENIMINEISYTRGQLPNDHMCVEYSLEKFEELRAEQTFIRNRERGPDQLKNAKLQPCQMRRGLQLWRPVCSVVRQFLRLDGTLNSLGGWIPIVLHTLNKGTENKNSVIHGDVSFR